MGRIGEMALELDRGEGRCEMRQLSQKTKIRVVGHTSPLLCSRACQRFSAGVWTWFLGLSIVSISLLFPSPHARMSLPVPRQLACRPLPEAHAGYSSTDLTQGKGRSPSVVLSCILGKASVGLENVNVDPNRHCMNIR